MSQVRTLSAKDMVINKKHSCPVFRDLCSERKREKICDPVGDQEIFQIVVSVMKKKI